MNVILDGKELSVNEHKTILELCREHGIDIPTLCHMDMFDREDAGKNASCRLCMVEVNGKLVPSCSTDLRDGMNIVTKNEHVIEARKMVLDLLVSDHPLDCMTCEAAGNCKLQDYCYEYDIKESSFRGGEENHFEIDFSNKFFYRELDKCILCRRCVNVCNEFQVSGALTVANRGFSSKIAIEYDRGMGDSGVCVNCGNCVSVCPVGALVPKSKVKFRQWEVRKIPTTCTYCGVGCQMNLVVKGNTVVDVEPLNGPANKNLLCVKGKFAYKFIDHPDRLTTPLVRKNGVLEPVSWDEAYDTIVEKYRSTMEQFGPEAFAGLASARCTNEDNYLFQKMVRVLFKTNSVDHCARLCHASTVSGLAATFGSGAMTNSIDEISETDVIFVTGSNTTETHPVIGSRIRRAVKKGATLIVADPRRIDLFEDAEVAMQIKPGTNIALFNGLMHVIIEHDLQDKDFIKERTNGVEELYEVVKAYTPERVADICGIDKNDIIKAALLFGKANKASIFFAMGVTQHATGTQGVMSIANLAMLTGNVGKSGTGVNPLRGQNNVQGACDLGGLPNTYPGYQKVIIPEIKEKFEKAWNTTGLSDKIGLTVTEIIQAAYDKKLRFLYIMGENPMVSDPDIDHVEEALHNLDFLVVQDIFLTETAELADVVLPAASFAEKEGTFTNTERRIQRVRKAVDAPGKAQADWEIISELMTRMGYPTHYNSVDEIMDEIASVAPIYAGVNFKRLETETLQWPVKDYTHPGTPFLHEGEFARGKGEFKPAEYVDPKELPDAEYPMILTTGRILHHYHTRSMTGRVEGIDELYPDSFIEINPEDAARMEVEDGETVKVTSRRSSIKTRVYITDRVAEGVVFIPFHFAVGAANKLTSSTNLDPIAKIPELKVSAVRVEKIADQR